MSSVQVSSGNLKVLTAVGEFTCFKTLRLILVFLDAVF